MLCTPTSRANDLLSDDDGWQRRNLDNAPGARAVLLSRDMLQTILPVASSRLPVASSRRFPFSSCNNLKRHTTP